MKVTSRICIALFVIAGVAFAPGPHNVVAYVEVGTKPLPCEFKVWDLTNMLDHTDYLDESTLGSFTQDLGTQWLTFFDIANFGGGGTYDDWQHGDTICILGSWAENEGTVSHAGWYWLFSDSITGTAAPDFFLPNDTLREMPMPVASQIAPGDTVIVEITNPYETDHEPLGTWPYDVLGYWVVCDTTGTGTEASYDVELGFAPVDGVGDSSTFFKYYPTDVFPSAGDRNTYHAYYIVARPETTTTPGVIPGFSTDAMSQNSNLLVVVGVAEYDDAVLTSFSARPSVFTDRTQFALTLPEQALVNIKLYDAAGQLVATVCDEVMTAGAHTVSFDGKALASGVYFYALKTDKKQLTGQIVKLH